MFLYFSVPTKTHNLKARETKVHDWEMNFL